LVHVDHYQRRTIDRRQRGPNRSPCHARNAKNGLRRCTGRWDDEVARSERRNRLDRSLVVLPPVTDSITYRSGRSQRGLHGGHHTHRLRPFLLSVGLDGRVTWIDETFEKSECPMIVMSTYANVAMYNRLYGIPTSVLRCVLQTRDPTRGF